ncbi:hypothetical protein K432DRAFT_208881 [Lepidopterella palustris CBS 459.81]|uniref:Uncharacterized protein n=1 Tax=Lepidopterella palustris CBS 459.81 TaxID=1314670 RepID=A0A8E2JHM4_9PEZI|nr:hypothetical protein K432DRAFT_208881 [Lepidopterella palustris CBS 459.81]
MDGYKVLVLSVVPFFFSLNFLYLQVLLPFFDNPTHPLMLRRVSLILQLSLQFCL